MKKKIEIIYQDEAIIIVNKPPNFLTVPDRFAHKLPSVYKELQKLYEEVFIVHRLDRETSGILCFAKTKEAHKHLCKQFEERSSVKIYLALVEGILKKNEGIIDGKLAEDPYKPGKMKVVPKKGKASRTDYKVIEQFKYYCLLEANIKTGRQHQIRVHMEHIGHPLMIDPLYNNKTAFYLSQIKRKLNRGKFEEERPLMSRHTLHARYLKIKHPESGEYIEFNADLPKDFKAVLQQLRKHNANGSGN